MAKYRRRDSSPHPVRCIVCAGKSGAPPPLEFRRHRAGAHTVDWQRSVRRRRRWRNSSAPHKPGHAAGAESNRHRHSDQRSHYAPVHLHAQRQLTPARASEARFMRSAAAHRVAALFVKHGGAPISALVAAYFSAPSISHHQSIAVPHCGAGATKPICRISAPRPNHRSLHTPGFLCALRFFSVPSVLNLPTLPLPLPLPLT